MADFNGIGRDFIKEGIFERFPELIPFVGENYSNTNHSRLLLICESNYFTDEMELKSKSVFKDAEKWYFGEDCTLIPEEKRRDVNNDGKITYLKGLFRTTQKLLNTNEYDDAAFYNYFLRPASEKNKKGKSDLGFHKDYTELDGEVAFVAFCEILKSLQPNIVIFASTLAWEKMEFFKKKYNKNFGKITIEKVSHPSSRWWNRYNGAYGRQLFENLLIKHWIKKFQKLQTIHSELRQKFLVEKDQECFFDENGNYLSCLNFKVEDYSFWCQTGVKINGEDFWTCFYRDKDSKEIPALNGKGDKLTQDLSNESIIEKIEKLINQIIEEIKETA
jgi:hypothetical protein